MARLVPRPLVPETGLTPPATPKARPPAPAASPAPGPAAAPAAAPAAPAKPARRVLSPSPLGGGRAPSPTIAPKPAARSRAASAAFDPPSQPRDVLPSRSHNQGPPLHGGYKLHLWRKAQAAAWKPPSPEVLRRRLKYAAECGLTLREYTLEIMERGRWLTPEKDAVRIAQIKSLRR